MNKRYFKSDFGEWIMIFRTYRLKTAQKKIHLMIFNDSILVLFPLVPMLFLLIIMVLYHKSHSKYLSENVLFIFMGNMGPILRGLGTWQRIGTFKEDQRRYWTNRILREKGVLSPETIFKKIKPANDTYQVRAPNI